MYFFHTAQPSFAWVEWCCSCLTPSRRLTQLFCRAQPEKTPHAMLPHFLLYIEGKHRWIRHRRSVQCKQPGFFFQYADDFNRLAIYPYDTAERRLLRKQFFRKLRRNNGDPGEKKPRKSESCTAFFWLWPLCSLPYCLSHFPSIYRQADLTHQYKVWATKRWLMSPA